MTEKKTRHKMSKQETEDWNELYFYVKSNVLGYDENQSLSKTMVLRLKGLLNNKFMANNKIKDTANYSYKVVLNTFKYCMPDIQRCLQTKSFNNEMHKFNYILSIVENNLNTVYVKMKQNKKSEEKIETIDMSIIEHNGAEYKVEHKTSDKFNEFW